MFHVADQTRPFDDAWYVGADDGLPLLDSVFLYPAAALACTDLIVNGVLERHPDLRVGIVELSAVWVPMYLMMLDGGFDFVTRLNGRVPAELSLRPSEYFHRQVRVSSFSYELPETPARFGESFARGGVYNTPRKVNQRAATTAAVKRSGASSIG
jgi:hypothetical protein